MERRQAIPHSCDTVWDIDSQQHAACLATRSALLAQKNVTSTLVRLGHVMESGKTAVNFERGLHNEFGVPFRFKKVERFPPEALQWQAVSRRKLLATKAARDLTDTGIERIPAHATDNWVAGDFLYVRLCIPGRKCGRTEQKTLPRDRLS